MALQNDLSGMTEWSIIHAVLRENVADVTPEMCRQHLHSNFYISSYVCPVCGKHLFKTNFPIGEEEPINVLNTLHWIKRIFTCPSCKHFYAPLEGQRLSAGTVYFLNKPSSYDSNLRLFDCAGTTQGRPDA